MSALIHKREFRKAPAGFSLVEIMVGMTIGLFGIMIMLHMLSVFESQKRTTAGGDDAQNAGAIALYGLQRDIQQAGYGISAQRLLGCNITLPAGVVLSNLGPVTINHASIPSAAHDANTDTLLVVYGNGNGPTEGDGITAQPTSPNVYTVQTQPSHVVGDTVIAQYAARQNPCALSLDTLQLVPGGSLNVTAATGVANIMTTNTTTGVTPILYNLGQAPKVLVYAVRNGNLTVCDYLVNDCSNPVTAVISTANESVWVPIAGSIVSLRAQYGRDTAAAGFMDGIVDQYDQTTPTADTAATACDWAKVSAVRLALVARGASGGNTTAAPTWAGSATSPINLGTFASWQNYRYKVFETTVPIRNITAQGVVSGC